MIPPSRLQLPLVKKVSLSHSAIRKNTTRTKKRNPRKPRKTILKMLQINFNTSPRATTLSLVLLLLFLLHTHHAICNAMPVLGAHAMKSGEIDAALKRACSRSIGDCLSEAETVDLESETSRRVLMVQQKKYISYETLRRDMVPCTTAGASYYNCHSGTANPYNRGCAVITWCARNIRDIKT